MQAELGELDTWQEDPNAWEDESDAAWEAEEVLRYCTPPCSTTIVSFSLMACLVLSGVEWSRAEH